MRHIEISPEGLRIFAVAGTHVITLGFDLSQDQAQTLLGFSIRRTDHTTNRSDWLTSFKVFKAVEPVKKPGAMLSTQKHPIQDFFWSDFTVYPGREYTYRIIAQGGTPTKLQALAEASVRITTEENSPLKKHNVYFNRGVAGSQAFVNKFGSGSFSDIAASKPQVWDWLSRGLKEALFDFIQQAKDETYAIRASIYECSYEPVLQEFRQAKYERNVDVQLVVHYKEKEAKKLDVIKKTIADNGLSPITTWRAKTGNISHNKFIVLLKDGSPVAIWTGSTNMTVSGVFGHSNVGHSVRDGELAAKYLAYWKRLQKDPDLTSLRAANLADLPDPDNQFRLPENHLGAYFSPRSTLKVLDWYVHQFSSSEHPVFITVPFGLGMRFERVLKLVDRPNLIFVITDKPDKELQSAAVTKNPSNRVAYGAVIKKPNNMEKWLEERTYLSPMVRFLHTKYLLIDPLGAHPTVITGSANFSEGSTNLNDENMLVIQDEKRVADIYFGEFMRLFRHFYFRDVENSVESGKDPDRIFLNENSDWITEFYQPTHPKCKQRLYFSGQ